ncbi:MAG TPA: ABC transporter permease [Anaerolineae bacterium]|nr:ABC transporter permease [Anaerolineae bacterium]
MFRQIVALTIKDLKVIFKDTGGVVALFLMPAMFIIVMSNALAGTFGSGSDQLVNVLVVNLDRGATGTTLVEDLKASGGINVETTWDHGQPLTRAQAEQLIVDQKRSIAIVIPEDFSHALQKVAFGSAAQSAQIELIVDPATSEQVVGPVKGALAGLSQQAAFEGLVPQGIDLMLNTINQNGGSVPAAMRSALEDTGSFTMGNGRDLVTIKETQPANMKIEQYPNTVQQNVPGWALFGVFFISGILAQSILEEKRTGAFRRLVASPMSRATVLLGKLVPHVIVNLIQITLLFLVGYFVLPLTGLPRLEWGAHPEGLIVVSICASITANALGLLLAAIAKSEQQLGGISTLLVLTLAAIGGVMVPRFVMPQFMQALGVISPHAWALNAYQDILMRGYGIAEILPECAVLLAMAAVMFVVAVRKFQWD